MNDIDCPIFSKLSPFEIEYGCCLQSSINRYASSIFCRVSDSNLHCCSCNTKNIHSETFNKTQNSICSHFLDLEASVKIIWLDCVAWKAEAKIWYWSVNCQLVTPLSIRYTTSDDNGDDVNAFNALRIVMQMREYNLFYLLFKCAASLSLSFVCLIGKLAPRKWVIKQWVFQLKIIISRRCIYFNTKR